MPVTSPTNRVGSRPTSGKLDAERVGIRSRAKVATKHRTPTVEVEATVANQNLLDISFKIGTAIVVIIIGYYMIPILAPYVSKGNNEG